MDLEWLHDNMRKMKHGRHNPAIQMISITMWRENEADKSMKQSMRVWKLHAIYIYT